MRPTPSPQLCKWCCNTNTFGLQVFREWVHPVEGTATWPPFSPSILPHLILALDRFTPQMLIHQGAKDVASIAPLSTEAPAACFPENMRILYNRRFRICKGKRKKKKLGESIQVRVRGGDIGGGSETCVGYILMVEYCPSIACITKKQLFNNNDHNWT